MVKAGVWSIVFVFDRLHEDMTRLLLFQGTCHLGGSWNNNYTAMLRRARGGVGGGPAADLIGATSGFH